MCGFGGDLFVGRSLGGVVTYLEWHWYWVSFDKLSFKFELLKDVNFV